MNLGMNDNGVYGGTAEETWMSMTNGRFLCSLSRSTWESLGVWSGMDGRGDKTVPADEMIARLEALDPPSNGTKQWFDGGHGGSDLAHVANGIITLIRSRVND